MKDGEIIELGQITLEAVWVPGHSYGSMVYLDHEHKCAFVGDAISEFNAWKRCTDYEECLQAYEKLLRKLPEELEYEMYHHHTGGIILNYNARVLPHRRNGEKG